MNHSFTDTRQPYPGTAELSQTEYHTLLSSERRRLTLESLTDRATPVELNDCAETVADAETDEGEASPETVDRVALTLHHIHLPKLSEFGVIEYDPERNQVTSSPGSS